MWIGLALTVLFSQVTNWLGHHPSQQARSNEDIVYVDHAFLGPYISWVTSQWPLVALTPRFVTKCKYGTRCGVGFRGGLISAENATGIGDHDSTQCEFEDQRFYFDTYGNGVTSSPILAIGNWVRFPDGDQPPYKAYRLTFNPNNHCMAYFGGSVIPWTWPAEVGVVIYVEAVTSLGAVSDSACQICAWPYSSYANSAHDACIVDRTKLQPKDRLASQCYVYCNSYSGGSQYYIDYSRSNFVDGQTVTCACSSPTTGQTVRMPASTCPNGTLQGLVDDPGAQENTGTDLDTASKAGSGGGAGGGNDTATHTRLDSILGKLGRSSYGDSIMDSLIRSDSIDTDSVTWLSDSVTGISFRLGLSHGDTGMSHGWTDDSLFRWSVRMTGIRDTSVTTDEFADWLIPIWKGLRALLLALWGLACFWIYYSIVKGD